MDGSIYARMLLHQLQDEANITPCAIAIRTPWTWKRMRSELRRDGARLLRKVKRKMVFGHRGETLVSNGVETLTALARTRGLEGVGLSQLAQVAQVPVATFADHNDPDCLGFLQQAQPDVIAFTGGGLIRKKLLSLAPHGVLNAHMGILPQWRGMDVVEWPVLSTPQPFGADLGITLHRMDSGVDTGPILLRRVCQVLPEDDFALIRRRLERMMWECMLDALRGLRDGALTPEPQLQEQGRQYYVMHPRIEELANRRLADWLETL
ncbi:hypothetical protein MAIT1_01103 [Magnetofaba australis IT-1]|uniref:phosphoribosylglycinamide formyltransferase 1 n=2 Tax=Magnetofaba TaxID=1472292 RepID=A0A1Y2K811_9PROT|nr:hypothetical protein MAIT1_01103 [Magnetofaba australis IT-1]